MYNLKKRLLNLLLVVAALAAALPVLAQDSPSAAWSVALYEQTTGKITRVSPAGEVMEEVALPVPETFDTYNYNIAIDPTGKYVAYIVSKVGDGTNPVQPSQLVIYDTSAKTISGTYDLNEAVIREGINAAADSLAFSSDGTKLVMGYYVPVEGAENQWMTEFVALDAATGAVINKLTGTELATAGTNAQAPYRTMAISFESDIVTLQFYPIFADMSPDTVMVNWNVTTNTINTAPAELVNAVDYFPATGEAITLTYDAAVDEAEAGENTVEGMLVPPNTVSLYNTRTGENHVIFAQDISIVRAKFVQNGERLLLFTEAGAHGVLIERDGTVVTEFPMLPGDTFTAGTPDGFIYADPEAAQVLNQVNTRSGDYSPTPLFTPTTPYNVLMVQSSPMMMNAGG